MKKSTKKTTKSLYMITALVFVLVAAMLAGCAGAGQPGQSASPAAVNENPEPVSNEQSESGGESGEGHTEGGESGDPASPILTLDDSWDGVVNGIRTAMTYDAAKGSFSGIVENTTNQTIQAIVIEINLKQGTKTVVELGPQPVGDLAPGEQTTVELLVADEPQAAGVSFDAWQIHPEAGGGSEGSNESGGEQHGAEGGGESGESGEGNEAAANALAINETYDVTKNGARLILAYDAKTNTFVGTVENVTNTTLTRARVEIHLSNGAELGPTTPTDLAPGQKINIELPATAEAFDTWSTHCEVGSAEGGAEHGAGESSEGGESGEEHGTEGEEGSGN